MRRLSTRCLLAGILAFSLLPTVGALAQTSGNDGQIQHYQRKYISFFYPQDYPLNQALAQSFQRDFPRFDYHLAGTHLNMDFKSFIQQTRSYMEQVAGDIAAGREVPDPRFGDKVVSWSDTQDIANAAYVFVPIWKMDNIAIDGPYPVNSKQPLDGEWKFDAQTEVDLNMELWNLTGEIPRLYDRVNNSWDVSRDDVYRVPVSELVAAAARYNEGRAASDRIDLKAGLSSSDRSALLTELRRVGYINRDLSQVENQDPIRYMMRTAVESIGYGSVISSVRGMQEFLIRAEVSDPDMKKDRVSISLGEGETPDSLGIGLDSSYKILEYVDGDSPREVGYVKIRELGLDGLVSQPIIVGRDFELGDQVVEYPKGGFGVNLRGGAHYLLSPGVGPGSASGLAGGGGLDIDGNIGPWFGVSELYFGLGGFYGSDSVGVFEAYLQKKWFMRQLIIALALRGGGALGPNPAQEMAWGATGLLGLHWQVTPDFAFGVDAGWRQYGPYSGPLLQGFIRWDG